MDVLFSFGDLVFRFFYLILAGLGIFCALRGVRMDRQAAKFGIGPWRKARLQLQRVAVVVLVGSVIANLVGNLTLSELLASLDFHEELFA